MKDEQLKRLLTFRFIIPIKIVIGAALAALLNPNNLEVHRMIAHAVTYSVIVCMF